MRIYVPLNQIDDNPYQQRSDYDDIPGLAGRILAAKPNYPETRGLMQVPRGRLVGDDGFLVPAANLEPDEWLEEINHLKPGWRVQLAFGHRRKRAFEHLNRFGQMYDAVFWYMPLDIDDLTDDQMLDSVWSENQDRSDITAVDRALLIATKYERAKTSGGSQRDVADAWGLARATVANAMALLKLPAEIQEANRHGQLSARQCQDLGRVAKIQEIANGSAVEWAGHMPDHSYGNPPAPDVYIAHVIENGESVSSDDVRKMTNRMLQHAGQTLPGAIADFDCSNLTQSGFEHIPEGQLTSCKGCPNRINETCLSPRCLKVKKNWYGVRTARAAAAEVGLPYSDAATDFDLFDSHRLRQKLRAYYEAGHRDNLVIGWQPAGNQLRPFHNSDWVYVGELYDGDGRRGVGIGHKTGIIPDVDESGEAAPPPDIADQAAIKGWKKRSGQLLTQCRRRARQAVKECLADDIFEFRVIMALVQPADAETTDDQEQLLTAFTKWLWDRGSWLGYTSDDPVKGIETIAAMLDRSGITRAVLELSLADRAVLWLSFWYEAREWTWSTHKHLASWRAISALRDEFEAAGLPAGEMLDLSVELDRAARDIRMVLGDKLEAVETAVSEEV
jgi:ParB/RepB/Spo0J family partition protein